MRIRMLWTIAALGLAVALISIVCAPAMAEMPTMSSGLKIIPSGQYIVVKDFIAQADASISYQVQVMDPSSAVVDVLLMDRQNFELYRSGGSFDYLGVSGLTVNSAFENGLVGMLIPGTEYFLVIDNTDRPLGGAPGNAQVQVIYGFIGTNIQSVTDWLMILIIIVAIAVVAIVVLAFLFLRKSKSRARTQSIPGQVNQLSGMKTCPRCGAQVPIEFTFCPQCGNRY
jgi:hypothetical protein